MTIEADSPTSASSTEDVGRRYVKAALHTGFGGIASRAFAGLAPIVLARYLGPKEYGIYALVLSLVGIVAGAAHVGQNNALQKFLPEYSVRDPRRGGAILADTVVLVSGILVIVCTGFFFLSHWIASTIYRDAALTRVFEFSALIVLFISLFNLASSAVAGLQDFKSYSKAMVIQSAGFLLLAWLGVWLLGLYGALTGQLVAMAISAVFLTRAVAKGTRKRFAGHFRARFSRDILGEIFSFAFPAFLAGIVVAPAYWWANTLLARDSGFEQVGLFGVAFALFQMIMVLPSNLSIPSVSFMSETYASRNSDAFSKIVSTNVRLIWALTLPISFASALFAPYIVRIAFGAAYQRAVVAATVMSFVALIMAVAGVVGNAVAGSGQMWHGFGLNALWLLAFGVSVAGFVPSWGANGLALAFAISYVFLALLVTLYAFVRLRVRFASSGVLAGLTAGCVLFTVSLPKGLSAVWLVAAAVAAECALLAVEWYLVLDEGERRRLIEAAGQIHRFNALPRRSGVSYVTSRVPRSGPEELAKSQE